MSKYLEKNQSNSSKQSNSNYNHSSDKTQNREFNLNNNKEYEHEYGQERNTHRSYIYDLFAVCNHKGQNMANGHYTGINFIFSIENII